MIVHNSIMLFRCFIFCALVAARLMAPRAARSALFGLLKINRQQPASFAEGNAFANMFGEIAGVHFMAGPACSPLYLFVDMDVVKVFIAISESGEGGGFKVENQGLLVAGKTKGVVLYIKSFVKVLGEEF